MLPAYISKTQFNLIILIGIIALSLLSIIWHHQTYTLYKQIKKTNIQHYQMMALNKQLLSEHSQIMSGNEIKVHAINSLGMKEAQRKDFGRWYKGNLAL
jgi:cell division protein FtsL